MFQMSKQLFNQCWPTIAAQIVDGDAAGHPTGDAALEPSHAVAAEAGYVLGVAMGYALGVDPASGNQLSASIPGWQAQACGELNWPRIGSPRMPYAIITSRR